LNANANANAQALNSVSPEFEVAGPRERGIFTAMSPLEILNACPLVNGFTDGGLALLAGIAIPRAFPAGSTLFVESHASDSMLLIGAGRVVLSVKIDGKEVVVGESGAGDWLGELALIEPGTRLCSATARSAVTAVEISHAAFQKLIDQKPQACIKLLLAICSNFARKVVANRDAIKSLARHATAA
jgi:CRP-like cAMP-binding protein